MRTRLLPPLLALALLAGCEPEEAPPPEEGCRVSEDCGAGQLCSSGVCLAPPRPCEPQGCAAFGRECGGVDDGCGSTVFCGSCTEPLTCGGAGAAGRCGCPQAEAACRAAPFSCTPIPDGCGGTVECGGCANGMTCGGGGVAGECGPIPRPFCWGRPVPVAGVDDPLHPDYGATVVPDPGGDRLLWISGRWSGTSETDLVWGELAGPWAVAPETVGPFPVQPTGAGWNGQPTVRADGLELWLYSSRPDANWADNDVYVVHRATLDSPWEGPARLQLLDRRNAYNHLLLPDDRTMIFRDDVRAPEGLGWFLTARRASTTPGDLSFALAEGPVQAAPPGLDVGMLALSCEQDSLLVRFTDGEAIDELVQLPILSMEPFQLGEPIPYPLPEGSAGRLLLRFESPDCRTLYFSDQTRDTVHAAQRVPCP